MTEKGQYPLVLQYVEQNGVRVPVGLAESSSIGYLSAVNLVVSSVSASEYLGLTATFSFTGVLSVDATGTGISFVVTGDPQRPKIRGLTVDTGDFLTPTITPGDVQIGWGADPLPYDHGGTNSDDTPTGNGVAHWDPNGGNPKLITVADFTYASQELNIPGAGKYKVGGNQITLNDLAGIDSPNTLADIPAPTTANTYLIYKGPGSFDWSSVTGTGAGTTIPNTPGRIPYIESTTTLGSVATFTIETGTGRINTASVCCAGDVCASVFTEGGQNLSIKYQGKNAFLTTLATQDTVNLSTQVCGSLPVSNGGTGKTTVTQNSILVGGATNTITEITAPSNNTFLKWNGTAFIWTGTDGGSVSYPNHPGRIPYIESTTTLGTQEWFTIETGVGRLKVSAVCAVGDVCALLFREGGILLSNKYQATSTRLVELTAVTTDGLLRFNGTNYVTQPTATYETTAYSRNNFATTASLLNYETTAYSRSNFATIASLVNYETTAYSRNNFATTASLLNYETTAYSRNNFATTASLLNYETTAYSRNNFATTAQLGNYTTTANFNNFKANATDANGLVFITGGNLDTDPSITFAANTLKAPIVSSTTVCGTTVCGTSIIENGQSLTSKYWLAASGYLGSLGDVNIGSPSNGEVLKYSGGKWINGTDNTGAGGGTPGGNENNVQIKFEGGFSGNNGLQYDLTTSTLRGSVVSAANWLGLPSGTAIWNANQISGIPILSSLDGYANPQNGNALMYFSAGVTPGWYYATPGTTSPGGFERSLQFKVGSVFSGVSSITYNESDAFKLSAISIRGNELFYVNNTGNNFRGNTFSATDVSGFDVRFVNTSSTRYFNLPSGEAIWNANKIQGIPVTITSDTAFDILLSNGSNSGYVNSNLLTLANEAVWNAIKINGTTVTGAPAQNNVLVCSGTGPFVYTPSSSINLTGIRSTTLSSTNISAVNISSINFSSTSIRAAYIIPSNTGKRHWVFYGAPITGEITQSSGMWFSANATVAATPGVSSTLFVQRIATAGTTSRAPGNVAGIGVVIGGFANNPGIGPGIDPTDLDPPEFIAATGTVNGLVFIDPSGQFATTNNAYLTAGNNLADTLNLYRLNAAEQVSADSLFINDGAFILGTAEIATVSATNYLNLPNSFDLSTLNNNYINASGDSVTGPFFFGTLSATTFSATNYRNLPTSALSGLSDTQITSPALSSVLKWNGTKWVPATDQTGGAAAAGTVAGAIQFNDGVNGFDANDDFYYASKNLYINVGTAGQLNTDTVVAQDIQATQQLSVDSVALTSPAAGALLVNSSLRSPTVSATTYLNLPSGVATWNANKLQGVDISTATPNTEDTLVYNGTAWAPKSVIAISNVIGNNLISS